LRWYFFHLGLVVQQERLKFRLYVLRTLKCDHGIYLLFIILRVRMFYNNNNKILHGTVLFGVRVSGTVIVVIYSDNILHSTCEPILYPRTPLDSSNTYARGTQGPDWGSDGERARKKRWIVDKLFGRQEINTLIFKNKLYRRVYRYTLHLCAARRTLKYIINIYTYNIILNDYIEVDDGDRMGRTRERCEREKNTSSLNGVSTYI